MRQKCDTLHLTDQQKQVNQCERAARQKAEEEAFAQLALEQRMKAANADQEFLQFVQQITEKEVALQKALEDAIADGDIDEEEQKALDLQRAVTARLQEEVAKAAAAAKARKAEEAATMAQAQANEAKLALKKTLEAAMADGVIDEDEQKAIDLMRAQAARAQEEVLLRKFYYLLQDFFSFCLTRPYFPENGGLFPPKLG
jgi:uncharacterized membrane protein YebE (DUF533 family)